MVAGHVTPQSKAWVCGRWLAGIVGSNPAGGMYICRECCVLLGRGLFVGPITRPEESCCVSECGREASTMRKTWPTRAVQLW